MTVTHDPELPVPAGGTPDMWTAAGVRDVYAQVGHVSISGDLLRCPAVTVIAEQRRNGQLGVIDVDVDARSSLSPAQARELAGLLNAGADLADRWAGTPGRSAVELLADAFAAVRAAERELRTAPGNAGDYARAALDSISDAAEVLR